MSNLYHLVNPEVLRRAKAAAALRREQAKIAQERADTAARLAADAEGEVERLTRRAPVGGAA